MSEFSWARFEACPIVGILRGFEQRLLPGIVRATIAGGLTSLEITMNSPDARGQIEAAVRWAGSQLNIGAGTVLDRAQLDDALAAGASFIVTPNLSAEVVRSCLARKIPVFPGTFTPQEVARAAELQVPWVKVFPADVLGPSHLGALKRCVPSMKLLATGGVTLDTLAAYLEAGADGFGIGSPLFELARVRAEDWGWLEKRCQAFVAQLSRL